MTRRLREEPAIIVEVLSACAITIGVGLIWWPAGLITGGIIFYILAQGMTR
jgi:hypothetical protein